MLYFPQSTIFLFHCIICSSEKELLGDFRVQEKINNSVTHALTMKLYIPKYSELLTSYLSIIQLLPPSLMYPSFNRKFPYMESVKFLFGRNH